MTKKEKIEYSNLDLYEGEVVDGKPNGYGVMYSKRRYVEETKFTSEGNQMYEGHWKDGEMHGSGTLIVKEINEDIGDVQIYVGDPFEGKKYVGEFQNGKLNGFATLSYVTPSWTFIPTNSWWKHLKIGKEFREFKFYEGHFKDDLFHGCGKMFFSDDTIKEGEWLEGKFKDD